MRKAPKISLFKVLSILILISSLIMFAFLSPYPASVLVHKLSEGLMSNLLIIKNFNSDFRKSFISDGNE